MENNQNQQEERPDQDLGEMTSSGKERKQHPDRYQSRKKLWIGLACGAAVLLLCGLVLSHYGWNAVLDRITRPILEQKDLTDQEISYWATYNPDAGEGEQGKYDRADQVELTVAPTLAPVEGDYITNILIIGQDYRPGEDTKLADSMILCSLNRSNATLTLTSFFRDTFVRIPAYQGHTPGNNRINVVYNLGWKWGGDLGGMEMMNLCMKENFGIEVDYNVEINFDTFIQIIDRLGGVDLDLTEAEVKYLKKDRTGINDWLRPGHNHVEGYTALCYARARKLDNDFNRTGRQRKVVSAILDKFRDKSLPEITRVVWDLLPLVVTNMSNEEITALLRDGVPLLKNLKINAGTCPVDGTFWGEMMELGGYPAAVLRFDAAQNRKMMQWICEVPAFEASPFAPPEIIPVPKKQKETEETEPTTVPPTETEAPAETQAPTVPQPPTEPETTAPTETQPAETQPSESRPVETGPAVPETTQPVPPETTETKPADPEPPEPETGEPKPAESQPPAPQPPETQPAPVETQPQPPETQPSQEGGEDSAA